MEKCCFKVTLLLDVFHVFQIVQLVPNRAKHHMWYQLLFKQTLDKTKLWQSCKYKKEKRIFPNIVSGIPAILIFKRFNHFKTEAVII